MIILMVWLSFALVTEFRPLDQGTTLPAGVTVTGGKLVLTIS